jgi:hypothetical protein
MFGHRVAQYMQYRCGRNVSDFAERGQVSSSASSGRPRLAVITLGPPNRLPEIFVTGKLEQRLSDLALRVAVRGSAPCRPAMTLIFLIHLTLGRRPFHSTPTVNDAGLRLSWDHGAGQRVNFPAPPDVF